MLFVGTLCKPYTLPSTSTMPHSVYYGSWNGLQRCAAAEEKETAANEAAVKKSFGREIDFGEAIQLQHLRSGNFITVLVRPCIPPSSQLIAQQH